MKKLLLYTLLVFSIFSCKQEVTELQLRKTKDVTTGLPELNVVQNNQSFLTVRSYWNGNFSILSTFANELADSAVSYNSRLESLESGGFSMVYPGAGIPLSTGSAWGTSITNNSTNWNTAYDDRFKWNGGSTGLVAATGRTSLGATTVGSNFFTLTNPSSITFPRINADNTVSALSAASFKSALSLTASDVNLGNVTNESKATMFTSPTFTGNVNFNTTSVTFSTLANSSNQWVYIDGTGVLVADYAEFPARFALDMGLPTPSEMLVRGENGEVPYYLSEHKIVWGLKGLKPSEQFTGLWSSDEIHRRQIKELEDKINTLEERLANLESLIQSK